MSKDSTIFKHTEADIDEGPEF